MILVDQVTKYYGTQAAVRDLSFRIEEGECVGFLGLNGAGKTTTLRILSCLSLPTSGSVKIRGLDAETEPHEIRKFIGFLPDRPPLYPEMTIVEFLRFAGSLRRMSKEQIDKRMPKVLETCGLTRVADQGISTLSHGFQQRVGIAQAIIHNPALLILDEPIQGLDPVQIVEMREMIRGLRGEHTILLSTHILSEIQKTCDRILMLHEGRITAQGTEEELASRFAQDVIVEAEVRIPAGKTEDALRAAIEKITSHELTIETADELDGDRVVLCRLLSRNDVREALGRAVFDAGFGLLSLNKRIAGLENIFVELSKTAPAASSPPPAKAAPPPAAVEEDEQEEADAEEEESDSDEPEDEEQER